MARIKLRQHITKKGTRYRYIEPKDGKSGYLEEITSDNTTEQQRQEKQPRLVIKTPIRIKIPTDAAYEKRREEFFSKPEFKPPEHVKTADEVFEEANGKCDALVSKISNNMTSIVKHGRMPGVVTEFAVKARRAINEAIDRGMMMAQKGR